MGKYLKWVESNFTGIILGLLFFTVAISAKKVFITPFSYATGEYSDFLRYSLYASDILAVLLIFIGFRKDGSQIVKKASFLVPFGCLILAFCLNISHFFAFNAYFLIKILEFYLLAWSIQSLWKTEYKKILIVFVLIGLFETIISILQFNFQSSVGLKFAGESLISPSMAGVAKIVFHGKRLIRPYGTFPHPNPLSAFLIFALFITIFIRTTTKKAVTKVFYEVCTVLLTFGIFLTLSRAGILSLAVGLGSYFIFLVLKKSLNRVSIIPLVIVTFASILSIIILKPYLNTRETTSDQGASLRILYNNIGLSMLKYRPIQGFGLGTSMLHMEQFSPRNLENWEVQPIHNYYLLSLVELGIIGAGALLWAVFSPFIRLVKKIFSEAKSENGNVYYQATLLSIFIAMASAMLFDHYFYTLQQTQLVLWITVGLIGAELKKEA